MQQRKLQILPHQRNKCKKIKRAGQRNQRKKCCQSDQGGHIGQRGKKRRKARARNEASGFFRDGKIDDAENGANAKAADGELHEHGETPTPVDGAIPKAQPNDVEQQLKICSWNIRRGLIKRELELKNILKSEKVNIMFLVETDLTMLNGKEDYKIEGYETILQKTDQNTEKIRIIGLVEEEMRNITKVRNDLMTKEFPSIWLEITRSKQKNLLICGFYREWTRNGNNSENEQSVRLKILINQMERATNEKKQSYCWEMQICVLINGMKKPTTSSNWQQS